jgi:hypothetical protein
MVPMDRGRQDWMMSTQRREGRVTLAMKIRRMVVRLSLRLLDFGKRVSTGEGSSSLLQARAPAQDAERRTAPPESPVCAATSSLQTDLSARRAGWHDAGWLDQVHIPLGSPPLKRTTLGMLPLWGSPGSVAIHFPAVNSRLHRALPLAPAAECCRTERYDGKRDLHFQHAA